MRRPPRLTLRETVELSKRQSDYQKLTRDFSREVVELLGGTGSELANKRAAHDLSVAIADTIARFVVAHTEMPVRR